jgi:hypothetical protein
VAITLHFLDNTFRCKSMLWDVVPVHVESLTAEAIKDIVDESLSGALAPFTLFSVVTDNGSNFARAAEDMVQDDRIPCVSHTLQLAIKVRKMTRGQQAGD